MKILAVFLNENKRLFREKGLILILLLMPLAFIVPDRHGLHRRSSRPQRRGHAPAGDRLRRRSNRRRI